MLKLNALNRDQYMVNIVEALVQEDIERFRQSFFELHPTDQKDIFTTIDDSLRKFIFYYISPIEYAEVFQELSPPEQRIYVKEMEENYVKQVLQSMFTDDVAAFIKQLPHEHALWYLKLLDPTVSGHIQEILSYPAESAGALMTKEYIYADPDEDVQSVMVHIKQKAKISESIYYIYVVNEEHHLTGVVSLRALILSDPGVSLREIMSMRVHAVDVNTDREEVAQIMQKYDFDVVPVTDDLGKLSGIITIDDVMDVVEQEINEDFSQMTAIQGPIDVNMEPAQAVKKRLPSLLVLMLFSLITAALIGLFERTLTEVVMIAIFIPLITDMSGNTGSQSLALIVRGLVLGTIRRGSTSKWIRRELISGLMLGAISGVVVSSISQILTPGDWLLGFIVGLSLFFSLTAATVTGAIIPIVVHRLKWSPSIASTPVITTINDIIGLLIYFTLATLGLTYL